MLGSKTTSSFISNQKVKNIEDDESVDTNEVILTTNVENNEKKMDVKRMIMTDEEAILEHAKFKKDIHRVIMKSRYFYWVVLMTLLSMALTLSYISCFDEYLITPERTLLVSEETRKYLVFVFFWSGFYHDHN